MLPLLNFRLPGLYCPDRSFSRTSASSSQEVQESLDLYSPAPLLSRVKLLVESCLPLLLFAAAHNIYRRPIALPLRPAYLWLTSFVTYVVSCVRTSESQWAALTPCESAVR